MSRHADIIARLRDAVGGQIMAAALIDELVAEYDQAAAGDVSVTHINDVQRYEIECLRGGLEAIVAGADPRRVAADTLQDADAIVREGGS